MLRLAIFKLPPSVICVHLSNLRPKLSQYLRVSVPLWQSYDAHGLRFIAVRTRITAGSKPTLPGAV